MKRTPLKRTAMKAERKPLRPVSKTKKRRREQAEGPSMKELRELLYVRCNGHCEACGDLFHIDQMEAHHRKKRSQGGLDRIENLVGLCHKCHPYYHANFIVGLELGFMVRRDQDPADSKVFVWCIRPPFVYLTADGKYATSYFKEES